MSCTFSKHPLKTTQKPLSHNKWNLHEGYRVFCTVIHICMYIGHPFLEIVSKWGSKIWYNTSITVNKSATTCNEKMTLNIEIFEIYWEDDLKISNETFFQWWTNTIYRITSTAKLYIFNRLRQSITVLFYDCSTDHLGIIYRTFVIHDCIWISLSLTGNIRGVIPLLF